MTKYNTVKQISCVTDIFRGNYEDKTTQTSEPKGCAETWRHVLNNKQVVNCYCNLE